LNAATPPMTVLESGLVVPSHVAHEPEPEQPADSAKDADGRRRVVLDRDTRKVLGKLARAFGERDIAVLFHCQTHRRVRRTVKDAKTGADVTVMALEPIDGACGEIMAREGDGTMDPGFGCKCQRVHFLAGR